MIKKPLSAFGLPTKLPEVISSEPPRQPEGHDEWLLDEALAETFPASDSIAVTPPQLLRASPPRMSREVERFSKIAACNIGRDRDPGSTALDTPIECDQIECDHCHTRIPATVALSFE